MPSPLGRWLSWSQSLPLFFLIVARRISATDYPRMWKPDKPIVIDGTTLTDKEAWLKEFASEFYVQCEGEAESDEWVAGLAARLYPSNSARPPREAAEVAFLALSYELSRVERVRLRSWSASRDN
ncbi:hypothetical protein J2W39_000045 [Variovorax paradoxus]|uniref:Uncharacterized protein n=1 Tax=Variovorax paradoxus TaxID=34073 RepID=A0AAW8E8E9_VARPD|nr:hypothetical protein [Variovorax paradoxus]MDP9968822.1 hypothetical protein [Variovorax paradoxus]